MKRAGFKPKAPPPRPVKRMDGYNPKPRAVAVAVVNARARMVVPVPKREYVRSRALMKAYRLIPCQQCHAEDGTVCGAQQLGLPRQGQEQEGRRQPMRKPVQPVPHRT